LLSLTDKINQLTQYFKNIQSIFLMIKFLVPVSFLILLCYHAPAQNSSVSITIHLRGVSESKVSLMPLSGSKQFKSVAEVQSIKNGETSVLLVPKEYLPGEFVLRFDYKEKKESTPYPSEKHILINDQDLQLWVSPMYCNNPDSTWFQKEERENSVFAAFSKENSHQKEKLGLLQQFLMNYDDTKSNFYQQGIEEYETRRQAYNQWLDTRVKQDKALFASSMYRFSYVPQISWEGSEKERMIGVINHYFDGIDFNDAIITKTSQLNEWMNSYVNLYGQMATTIALRDSLIPAAAKTAVEKAKQGNPIVYGWMVDYFYRGFESNNLPQGMKVLEPYLNDPNCLTSKRMEIERRLKGMETLVKGSIAPDISLKGIGETEFELKTYSPNTKYILLFFWSADCSHCIETVDAVYPWQQLTEVKQKVSVVGISLDETETEVKVWEQKIKEMNDWNQLRAPDGVRSKVASDYYVLATPVMILIDAKTKEIIALPSTFKELKIALQ
jgi:thiol-disulfide isomerase/thioredoxin